MSFIKTVYIADDDEKLLEALKRRCETLNVNVMTGVDGLDAMLHISESAPDLAILDVDMPVADGLSVCEKLSERNDAVPVPTIFLTGQSDQKTVRRCRTLGAHYVYKDSDAWKNLKPLICEILEIREEGPPASKETSKTFCDMEVTPSAPTVLAIDDDPDILRALKVRIESAGVNYMEAANPQDGFVKALENRPDVIITDYLMPEASGLYLIQRLRNCPATKHIPVIVVTGQTRDGKQEDLALNRWMSSQEGVIGYLQKPVEFEELYSTLRKCIELPDREFTPSIPEPLLRQNASSAPAFGRRGQ